MIRKLILAAAAATACYTAAGQSFEEMLGSAIKSAVAQTQHTDAATGRTPSADQIQGQWSYNSPIIKYTGNDPMAALAIGGLNSKLAVYCSHAGLKPGDANASLTGGRITVEIPKHKTTGKYKYHPTGKIELTFSNKDREGTLHGRASTDSDGALTLMFDMQDALEVIHAITGKYSGDKNIDQLAEMLKQYPGIEVGLKLDRR